MWGRECVKESETRRGWAMTERGQGRTRTAATTTTPCSTHLSRQQAVHEQTVWLNGAKHVRGTPHSQLPRSFLLGGPTQPRGCKQGREARVTGSGSNGHGACQLVATQEVKHRLTGGGHPGQACLHACAHAALQPRREGCGTLQRQQQGHSLTPP